VPHTQLLFRDEARAHILAGAALLADAVSVPGALLLAEATLTEIDDEKKEAQPDLAAGM
jgi:hypothetical protein